MAHKKAAWSTRNLKDSKPKYRWVKVFWWQKVNPWNIIIRQSGNKFECGKNVYMWRDFTILSKIAWEVSFKKKKFRRFDGRVYLKTVVEVLSIETKNQKTTKMLEKKSIEKEVPVKKEIKKIVEKTVEKQEIPEKKAPVKKAPAKKEATEKKASVKKTPAKKAK